ncbi:LysM peptidoglycan-binding domain-containing protein [Methylogaea oryzae]|nr:LysM peptidoglycan-binding domain-containing protein [Methylogaea oryzae]
MNIRNTFIGLLTLIACTAATAGKKEVVLNPQHPDRYVVTAGDTLWDVAGKFLKDPWQWPDLWETGKKAERPLRPGDVLTLISVAGVPRLQLNGGNGTPPPRRPGDPLPEVKLSPKVRASDMAAEIPLIPFNLVRAFLSSPKVVTHEELDNAPYVLELPDNRHFAGTGDKLYVRGLEDSSQDTFGVFHKGSLYKDGESGEELGYEAMSVGTARLTQEGDPAIFTLANTTREAVVGDRLLPQDDERIPSSYEPRPPAAEIKGHIIAFLDSDTTKVRGGASSIGQYAVVALDRGSSDGLEVGHVLEIDSRGKAVKDKVSGIPFDSPDLPNEAAGSLLIFRCFERVSYGLIMHTSRELRLGDVVRTPN